MAKIFLVFLFLVFINSANIYSQDILTLRQAISNALANNFSIRLVKQNIEIANANNTMGKAGMLPTIDVGGNYKYSSDNIYTSLANGTIIEGDGAVTKTLNGNASLNWTLFDGFAMWANYEKLGLLKQKSQIELQISIENNIRQITDVYYSISKLKQTLKIISDNISQNKDRINRLENRKEFGQALSTEILQAKVSLNSDSSLYLQTELNYENSKRQLKLLMGTLDDRDFDTESEVILSADIEGSSLKSKALSNNSSISLSLKNNEITNEDLRLAYSSYYPRVALNTSYNYNRNEAETGFVLESRTDGLNGTLSVNWNLFNGGRDDINAQIAKVNQEINNITTDQLKATINYNFDTAYDNLIRRKKILELENQNLNSAKQNYDRAKNQYEFGQISAIELRDAQINLSNILNRINEAQFTAKIAETEIYLLTGQILNMQ